MKAFLKSYWYDGYKFMFEKYSYDIRWDVLMQAFSDEFVFNFYFLKTNFHFT